MVRSRPSRSSISGLQPRTFSGQRDVRLADLRVVRGQGLVDDLGLGARDLDHRLGQLQQRELVRIAHIDRIVVAGLRQRDHPADQVVHVAERPRLSRPRTP